MGGNDKEVEIKLALPDPQEGLRLLQEVGFSVRRERYLESNVVYDRGDELRHSGSMLRLRDAGGVCVVTFKGPASSGRHKVREELEIISSDTRMTGRILERLGFVPRYRYEKYRTDFHKAGDLGLISLDETPIGCYLELEGPPEWIDSTANALHFAETDYVLESYGQLHREFSERLGRPSGDMLFYSME